MSLTKKNLKRIMSITQAAQGVADNGDFKFAY